MGEYVIPEQVLSRELDGEAVLLDLRSGHYFGLNPTAARMWSLLKDGVTPEKIVRTITDEFAVAEARAQQDVERFVETLLERGLITTSNGSRS